MAISQYSKPQLTIAQLLDRISAPSTPRMATVILAPKFLLNRYGKETEVPDETFTGDVQTLAWKYSDEDGVTQDLPATHTVDLSSITLRALDLEASLTTFTDASTNKCFLDSLTDPTVIKLDNNKHFKGGTLETTFYGRPVAIGDTVLVDDGLSGVKRRTVTELIGVDVASSFGANTTKDDSRAGNSDYNPTTVGAASVTYTSAPVGKSLAVDDPTLFNATVRGSYLKGKYGEEFTVTVRTGGAPATATVDITSRSGLWGATNVATVNNAGDYEITSAELAGLSLTITAATLVAGEKFIFEIYQEYTRLDHTLLAMKANGTYTGTQDTTYVIEVAGGTSGDTFANATLTIYDTAGVDTTQTGVTVANNTYFGVGSLGLEAKFIQPGNWTAVPQGGLRTGDKYVVHAVAASAHESNFDKVRLSGTAANTAVFGNISQPLDVEFILPYSGLVAATDAADESAWAADAADGVTVEAGLALYVPDRTSNKWVAYKEDVGGLVVSYRAAVPAGSGGMIAIDDVDDIITQAGVVDIENDAAFGLQEALNGAQGRRIYWLNTGGTELANYTAALKKISSTDRVTFLGVCTEDPTITAAVKQHCETMSSETRMNFRRCYVGANSPGEYVTVGAQSNDSPHTATIDPVGLGGANLVVNFTTDIDLEDYTIVSGDQLRLVADPDNIITYTIAEVRSATELRLSAGPASPVSPAVPVEIWRQDDATSQGSYVRNRAKALNSRRAMLVWQESGSRLLDDDAAATEIPNRFQACHIAGLRSALLPQQGLTRTEVSTITACPAMYTKYEEEDLDAIAADGVCVITQEYEDGPVFIRHQLTTDPNNGLLYYEDSVGVVGDYVALQMKDSLGGFIGKRNVTNTTINDIRSIAEDILVENGKVELDASYGPLIDGFEDLVVERNATMADTIDLSYTLLIGPPLNRIKVKQRMSI